MVNHLALHQCIKGSIPAAFKIGTCLAQSKTHPHPGVMGSCCVISGCYSAVYGCCSDSDDPPVAAKGKALYNKNKSLLLLLLIAIRNHNCVREETWKIDNQQQCKDNGGTFVYLHLDTWMSNRPPLSIDTNTYTKKYRNCLLNNI